MTISLSTFYKEEMEMKSKTYKFSSFHPWKNRLRDELLFKFRFGMKDKTWILELAENDAENKVVPTLNEWKW